MKKAISVLILTISLLLLSACTSDKDLIKITNLKYYPVLTKDNAKILDRYTESSANYATKEINGKKENVYTGENVSYFFSLEYTNGRVENVKVTRKDFLSLDVDDKYESSIKSKLEIKYKLIKSFNENKNLDNSDKKVTFFNIDAKIYKELLNNINLEMTYGEMFNKVKGT